MRYESLVTARRIRFPGLSKRLFLLNFASRFYKILMEYLCVAPPVLLDAYGAYEYLMKG